MKGFILVGHGPIPDAITAAVKMMAGEITNIHPICLMPEEGIEQLREKFEKLKTILETYDQVIVFADLFGGTPSNSAFQEFKNDKRFSFITGMNFPMVLTAVLTPEMDIKEIIHSGRNGIKNLRDSESSSYVSKDIQHSPVKSEKMIIKNIRVDARGIHGQVATAWIPQLQVNRIIVIDDLAVKDPTQKIALKMARPNNTKLSILSTDTAIKRLQDENAYPGEQVLILILRIETLKVLLEKDFIFDKINLGNVPARTGTKKYRNTVHLTDAEREIIETVMSSGTKFTTQIVPNDAVVDFKEYLK